MARLIWDVDVEKENHIGKAKTGKPDQGGCRTWLMLVILGSGLDNCALTFDIGTKWFKIMIR